MINQSNNQSATNLSLWNLSLPAYLVVGSDEIKLYETAHSLLRSVLCKEFAQGASTSCRCHSCKQLYEHQHHAVMWFLPDKQYKIEDLEPLFEMIRLAQNPGDSFFFVLQKAHQLSTICSNKLLKVFEEPPAGYHFLLIANYDESILPTLKSRCSIISLEEQSGKHLHPILTFFTSPMNPDPFVFESEIKRSELSNLDSIELYNNLLVWALEQHKRCYDPKNNIPYAQKEYFAQVVDFLKLEQQFMPAPGGSELFWKSLYLTFPRAD